MVVHMTQLQPICYLLGRVDWAQYSSVANLWQASIPDVLCFEDSHWNV